MNKTMEELKTSPQKSLKKRFINFAFDTGLVRTGWQFSAKFLTVLNYHRIGDLSNKQFDSFKPNISASQLEFSRQMDYVSKWFNVISLNDFIGWLDGSESLPPHAAMITFDDGYLDNYTLAYPILKKYDFTAIIFLTTGHINTDTPFYWDLAAYCFHHTTIDKLEFPNGKEYFWKENTLDDTCKLWIESMKRFPEAEKLNWVARLPELLHVSIPSNFFRNLMMTWDQVREMHRNRIDFGAHTISHPILTRVPLEKAKEEIEGSKTRIEIELGKPVLSFAYPNGLTDDLNSSVKTIVSQSGVRTAFTLSNGPSPLQEVKRDPLAIRRVFISAKHTLPQFATLVSPLNRLRLR